MHMYVGWNLVSLARPMLAFLFRGLTVPEKGPMLAFLFRGLTVPEKGKRAWVWLARLVGILHMDSSLCCRAPAFSHLCKLQWDLVYLTTSFSINVSDEPGVG